MILGVTGLMGSGKSTACAYLSRRFGFAWIEADALVEDLYRRGRDGYKKIGKYFGPAFLTKTGVNRPLLRSLVLADTAARALLNKIMGPLITRAVNKKIVQFRRACRKNICIEAFYFNKGALRDAVDLLIEVRSPHSLLLKRRDTRMPLSEYKKMLNYQRRYLPKADCILRNDARKERLFGLLEAMLLCAHE